MVDGYATPINNLDLTRDGMNDVGQIVLNVDFENLEDAVIRLDPFVLQAVHESDLSLGVIETNDYATMSQMIDFSPVDEMFGFDFAFPAGTGNLVVLLGDNVLTELGPTDGEIGGLTRFEMQVDLAGLFPNGTSQALLEFQLYSNDGTTGLYLDNVNFGSLENGDFSSGDLASWQSSFSEGDGVGVAVNPYGITAAVPEPASLLLALVGLGLLPRRRRGN